ncbi:MAG TPA: tripartite tricarboxylate transporter substrate-binding protein [Steroidobacteraceae bacterium]|nr:tripartite tricarboxylate transporter substrate-binding protein [Steroidobacteraceae bacterium]
MRIVTVGAGSQNDILARLIGPKLSESWGQPVIIENRAGAGGALAAATVAKATPDGYTVLMLSNQFAIGAALHANLPYDAVKDFAGVSQIGIATVALVVPPSLGVKSVKDLIALAQAKAGQVVFSSSGAGSGTHMNGEMFRLAAGIKAVHVGFRSSSEASIEVAAGRVQYSVLPLGPVLPFIKDGRVLALAVANQRSPLLPDVPAMTEVLSNYERAGSFGLLAPARTPRPVLHQISKEVSRVLDLPDIKERLQGMGFAPAASTPEEFEKIVRSDIETFKKMARIAGLRAK